MAVVCAVWLCAGLASAGDWPQILGPNRDGRAQDERLANSWPDDGLPELWQRKVDSGFSGIAVADGTAILFHRVGDEERVEAMDAKSGDVLWTRGFRVDYQPSIVTDNGPRCVPVIRDGRVFVFGVAGGLRCLEVDGGKEVWSRETHEEFGAQEGYFGAGSSPIVLGDRILVNVGGSRQGAGVVAFSCADGKTLWKATSEAASYSSPVAATIDGMQQAIFVTRMSVVAVDPAAGKLLYQFPFGQRGPTVNGANPVVFGDRLFVTASYGVGAVLADIEANSASAVWKSDDVLSSQYTTPIYHDGMMYGIDGRQDLGVAELRCFDPSTQKVAWAEPSFGYATLIEADGKLLIMKTDGELVLAELNPGEFRELGRDRLLRGTARALPALADGRLYVRDEQTLKCVHLSSR